MALFQAKHVSGVHVHLAGDRCPTCDQPIPNDRLEDVNNRIAARERQLKADAEARLSEVRQSEQARAAAVLATIKAEFATREDALRKEGEARAAEGFAAKLQDAVARAAQIEDQLRIKAAEVTSARDAAAKQVTDLQAAHDAVLTARLTETRDALEKAKADAVNAEQAKSSAKLGQLEGMVADLQRKLQNKTAEELGEGAEVDLFELLKAEFPSDLVTRVGRGNAGADVIHEVRHNGVTCGKIVYDSKNHLAWRNDHVTKLREDQRAAKAEHAVLSTRAFPKDKRQLHIDDGVIVANPARAIVVAMLLRQHIVQVHGLKISNDKRASKTEELYALMTSDRFGQFLAAVNRSAEKLDEIQVQEKKAHEAVWKKQGELFRTIIRTCAQFDEDIARIIGTSAQAAVDPSA